MPLQSVELRDLKIELDNIEARIESVRNKLAVHDDYVEVGYHLGDALLDIDRARIGIESSRRLMA